MKPSVCFSLDIDPGLKLDTLRLKEGQTLIVNNKKYPVSRDTIVYIPSSIKYKVKTNNGDVFFEKLARQADKRRWTRELHNVIIAKHGNNLATDTIKTVMSISPFVRFAGRPIRRIKIKQLTVFGPTIDDTTRLPVTWLENAINKSHFQTKEYLIRNNLLFKEGDYLSPTELADNERLLRALPYIEDAQIIVKRSSELSDSVDVLVLTKDVMAKAFDLKLTDVNSGQFQSWDKNIFGFGQENQNTILWDTREVPSTGYQGGYKINNIAGTFFSGNASYYNSFHTESFGVGVDRSFFIPNVKYAGGISLSNTRTRVSFLFDTAYRFVPLRYSRFDSWIGRSFLIHRDGFAKLRHNVTFAGRIIRDQFFERPPISEMSYYNYQNKTLYLGSIAYTMQSFLKSNFIYNFGRTEDIPIGNEISGTMGFEKNEYLDRKYAGFNLASSTFGDLGYIDGYFGTSSFFNSQEKPEQAVVNTGFKYFSPLILYGKYKFRQFVTFDYMQGINRFANEYLTINNAAGISGFMNDSVRGTKRINMHWETDCFTPWRTLDFRFVLFLSADHTWIGDPKGFYNRWPYSGVSFGVRIRNVRLVFNTIQVKFSVYPKIPGGSSTNLADISGEPLLNPPSFLPSAPSLITFQ
jgi:hypothetical protein